MKKTLSLILVAAMLLSLAACGGNTDPSGDPASNAAPAASYTYTFEGMMGQETAQIDLNPDHTCKFWLPGNEVIQDVYTGIYTQDGNTVSIFGLKNVDKSSEYMLPGLWDWIVEGNCTITVDDTDMTFTPAATATDTPAAVFSGSYTYTFAGMMGEETAQIDLAADGTCQFYLPGNPMITDVYAGTYTADGATVSIVGLTNVDASSPYATPGLWDWIVDGNATITVSDADMTFTPAGGQDNAAAESGSAAEADGLKNISYASTSAAQICDIYLPEGAENYPVIILVHGGGFMFGDQGMDVILPVIDKALENGYAVVSVDYRKASEAVFPAALADVKAAVRFVKAHAADYGWDPEKITVWGESAGAYLSLMTALTPDWESLNGDVTDYGGISCNVQALVSFYAPVEFYTLYKEAGKPESAANSFESKFLGQDIMADEDTTYTTYWESYSEAVPEDLMVWIQAGDADSRVPHTQSVNFAARLQNYLPAENIAFSIIEGADHEDDLFYTDGNLDAVFAWLDSIMKG